MTATVDHDLELLRGRWMGLDVLAPVAAGGTRPYTNLDNTATTPPLRMVRDRVDNFLTWYSSVHRGTGYKSQVSTAAYEDAREIVGRFVGSDAERDRVVFTKHTTESTNVLAAALGRSDKARIAVSAMEHHSNLLPWRRLGEVDDIEVDPDGRLRLDSLEATLRRQGGAVRLVALTAASNVTGYLNPIHEAAAIAHRYGARIVVDAAQAVAHRQIDMRRHDDPGHIDFLVFSGHKIFAPYGVGVLVGDATTLDHGEPLLAGGGAVDLVTRRDVLWAEAPDRLEAGSPNVVGAVALATALQGIADIGFDTIEAVEAELTRRLLRGLAAIDGARVLGGDDPDDLHDRLGVVTFTLDGLHHGLVAAALSAEWAVGVRDGCFCAHPYLLHLLRVDDDEVLRAREAIAQGDRRAIPGAVRASVAPYNTTAEVDQFLDGVTAIRRGDMALRYRQDIATGGYDPVGWSADPRAAFSMAIHDGVIA